MLMPLPASPREQSLFPSPHDKVQLDLVDLFGVGRIFSSPPAKSYAKPLRLLAPYHVQGPPNSSHLHCYPVMIP
jgi:hypothetical protein